MPYSPSHGYVHVCIPKTGTTSVSRAFRDFHDRHGGAYELLREPVDRAFRRRHGLRVIGERQPGRAKHLSALQLRAVLGDAFERSFRFSFVRNPWARCVSQYHFTRVDHEPAPEDKRRRGTRRRFHDRTFEDWLTRRYRWWRWLGRWRRIDDSQWRKISDHDGGLLVDYVGRLERVQQDTDAICDRIGLPRLPVPWVNPTRHGRYVGYYTPTLRRFVDEMYARDIQTFDYTFGA